MHETAIKGDWFSLIPDSQALPTVMVALESASYLKTVLGFINACLPFPFQLLNPNYIYDGEFCCLSSTLSDLRPAVSVSEHLASALGHPVGFWVSSAL